MSRIYLYGPPATGKTSLLAPLLLSLYPGLNVTDEDPSREEIQVKKREPGQSVLVMNNQPPADDLSFDMIFETFWDQGTACVRRLK